VEPAPAAAIEATSATSNAITLTTEATSDVTLPSVPTNVRIVGSFGCPEFFVGWTQADRRPMSRRARR
jgi:hypothetical protein